MCQCLFNFLMTMIAIFLSGAGVGFTICGCSLSNKWAVLAGMVLPLAGWIVLRFTKPIPIDHAQNSKH